MQPLVLCCGLRKYKNAESHHVLWLCGDTFHYMTVLCLFCCETDIISKRNLEIEIEERWELGEGLFFCLSLLSGCKGTICFCPSFLLRTSNIFHLEWSFPQKGEKFTLSFSPFHLLHFANKFSPFQFFLINFPLSFIPWVSFFAKLPIMSHNKYLWVTNCDFYKVTGNFKLLDSFPP